MLVVGLIGTKLKRDLLSDGLIRQELPMGLWACNEGSVQDNPAPNLDWTGPNGFDNVENQAQM